MPSCQSRREPPQGWEEDWFVGEVLAARKEAHVAETVELTMVGGGGEEGGAVSSSRCHRTRTDKVCVTMSVVRLRRRSTD